jgi:hypothetical protein
MQKCNADASNVALSAQETDSVEAITDSWHARSGVRHCVIRDCCRAGWAHGDSLSEFFPQQPAKSPYYCEVTVGAGECGWLGVHVFERD